MPETRLPQSAFDALVRMDGYERQRLEAITARSARLTGSAAIVAGLAGFAIHSSAVVGAVALFVVAAALGVAAQWPLTGEGLHPGNIVADMTDRTTSRLTNRSRSDSLRTSKRREMRPTSARC